jgi:glycosyltransferase involved in cell wall biosynthesis
LTPKLSCYILTFNNGRTLETALNSVTFADEVVIVDSGSDDDTLAIARKYTDKILHRPWPGFREQYQYAQDQCTHEWVMFIDADEEVSPTLVEEIQTTLEKNAALPDGERVEGFHVHRRTFFIDRWIMHGGWVPDHEIRVYRKACASWKGGLHAKIHVDGNEAYFKAFLYHDTYADIKDQLRTLNNYSSSASADLMEAEKCCSLVQLIGRPIFRFIKEYIFKGGFRDGVPGLIIAVNNMNYAFNKHAKLWEQRRLKAISVEESKSQKPKS